MASAAIYRQSGAPLEVSNDVEVSEPHAGEIKIRMNASGVCHSDLSAQSGVMLTPPNTILGHEGSAVITALGEGVTNFAVGDPIVVSWVPQCGVCFFCSHGQPQLCEQASITMATASMLDGTRRSRLGVDELGQMAATGTFATEAVIPAIAAVPNDPTVDPVVSSLIGCGVLTGVGAALNTAVIKPGDTVAVIGCGGVGLNVIQGCKIAGAGEIIAIDRIDEKLALASEFGATSLINASAGNPVSKVMDLTSQRGADVAFEVIGLGPTIDQAVQMTRRGGQAILVGIPAMDVMIHLPAFFGVVLQEKTIKGCWYGSSNVHHDVPQLLNWYKDGSLKLDALISARIELGEVNEALAKLKEGSVTRSVIVY